MIAYLPQLHQDELVYSWFCRYYVHSGCFSHKMALQDLYCKKSDNPSKEFIGNLNSDARMAIERAYSIQELILHHTLFPQYARFIPLKQKLESLKRIGRDSCDIHHLFCVLPRTTGELYMRYCPTCVSEDRKLYAEAYWHRKHQLRNVDLCAKHGCRLKESNVLIKNSHNYILHPAENYVDESQDQTECNALMLEYVRFVDQVFSMPVELEREIDVQATLRNSISKTKYYIVSTGEIRVQLLADELLLYYKMIGLRSIASFHQIQRVLHGSRFDFSVVCQLAFFLGIQVEELCNCTAVSQKIVCKKTYANIDWNELDTQLAPVVEQLVKSIYDGTVCERGRPERVSERIVYRELRLPKHRLEKLPQCKAIFDRYTETYPESWARKIVWAYNKLSKEAVVFYWSDIRELSGVKKKDFEDIKPFLCKYTDSYSVNRIVELVNL